MKMEVETGKRQLINLSRRAAEMLSNWSRGPATEDLIDKAISLPLRNETEVDNEILAKEIMGIWRMLRTFFPDGTITQQLPWLMSLNYASHSGLLVDTWCGDEKLHVDACFFLSHALALLSIVSTHNRGVYYCECICQTAEWAEKQENC